MSGAWRLINGILVYSDTLVIPIPVLKFSYSTSLLEILLKVLNKGSGIAIRKSIGTSD